VIYSADEAYTLYNDYALRIGFSIRKGKSRYHASSRTLRLCDFLFSKEGFKLDEDNCEGKKKMKSLETIVGYKAFIRFTIENGIWKVVAFNPKHNHDLALPSERHLLRSGRHISKPKVGAIVSMVNVGIRTKNAYS
jgi:hypothetical protein